MSGVQNDYNAQPGQGDPRTRIGNWVEERALRAVTGQTRGSAINGMNDTATRINGPVLSERDYATSTRLAHESTLTAPHGPAFVAAVAPPRRAATREAERAALAAAIVQERLAAEEAAHAAMVHDSTYGQRTAQSRQRGVADPSGRSMTERAAANPLNGAAISFHTHHLASLHGTTPSDKGVHTFSRDSTFSKPLAETLESGTR